MAEGPHPFPSRTRQLSPPAPMVLHFMWESRSLPGIYIYYKSFAIMARFFLWQLPAVSLHRDVLFVTFTHLKGFDVASKVTNLIHNYVVRYRSVFQPHYAVIININIEQHIGVLIGFLDTNFLGVWKAADKARLNKPLYKRLVDPYFLQQDLSFTFD